MYRRELWSRMWQRGSDAVDRSGWHFCQRTRSTGGVAKDGVSWRNIAHGHATTTARVAAVAVTTVAAAIATGAAVVAHGGAHTTAHATTAFRAAVDGAVLFAFDTTPASGALAM